MHWTYVSRAQIPLYTLPSSKPAPGVHSMVQDNVAIKKPEKWLPSRVQQRQNCQYDRFIPQRRRQNFEASNYYLTKVPPRDECQNQLDVFSQILKLKTTWRKKIMKCELEKSNLLPTGEHQRVLNIGKSVGVNRENYRDVERPIDDTAADGVWKTKARIKPLIGLNDVIANVPTMRHMWRRGLLDWGATNYITAMIGTTIVIFDGSSKLAMTRPGRVIDDITAKTHAIKWNNKGTKIAVCTEVSEIMIHDLTSRKRHWCRECRCKSEEPTFDCEVLCVAWTQTDNEVVIGCTKGRISSYVASEGTIADTIFAHTDMILAIAFSPNDRYLVSTGMDKAVRVHTWPSLAPHVAIGYYEPVQALAWHPWETDKLCVGGGFQDGSLSLWDIHRQTPLGYRKVPFFGLVKNMTWNKLSGELVVQWNYQHDDLVRAVVPVLSSLDQVVDLVWMASRILDIVWNPDGTQLAMRGRNTVKVWNFFGNETSNWYDEKEKCRQSKSAGRTSNFQQYTIR